MAKITDLILDFDGTCTQIPLVHVNYLREYLAVANQSLPASQHISSQQWEDAKATIHEQSPAAGWTVATTPCAPSAGDPYMLSYEAGKYIVRTQSLTNSNAQSIPASVFTKAYGDNPAPWRVETLRVLKALHAANVFVHLVTNSDTATVSHRLQDLWGGEPLPATIKVIGNAAKYNINEPFWDSLGGVPPGLLKKFHHVPVAQSSIDIGRPLYLRRGNFFSIIASIFQQDPGRFETSLFCGDVWELDLALPAAMGANIHLIERAAPFDTYAYERDLTLKSKNGRVSNDLNGLLDWLK